MNRNNVVRLTESKLREMIAESVKQVLRENEEYRFMGDEDIASQYNDMRVIDLTIVKNKRTEGWNGSIEIEFPDADGVDYNDYVIDNFFVYDDEGTKIAFDNWYPDEQINVLKSIIRKELQNRRATTVKQ